MQGTDGTFGFLVLPLFEDKRFARERKRKADATGCFKVGTCLKPRYRNNASKDVSLLHSVHCAFHFTYSGYRTKKAGEFENGQKNRKEKKKRKRSQRKATKGLQNLLDSKMLIENGWHRTSFCPISPDSPVFPPHFSTPCQKSRVKMPCSRVNALQVGKTGGHRGRHARGCGLPFGSFLVRFLGPERSLPLARRWKAENHRNGNWSMKATKEIARINTWRA